MRFCEICLFLTEFAAAIKTNRILLLFEAVLLVGKMTLIVSDLDGITSLLLMIFARGHTFAV